jgi:hypothetical protein
MSTLNITETIQTLTITETNGDVVTLTPIGTTTLTISEVGVRGLKGDTPTATDIQVKQNAEAGDSDPTYDETDVDNPFIVSMVYSDANGATLHSKVFNYIEYLGESVVSSVVNTFTYELQIWTYTKTINYKDVGGVPVWDGTDSLVAKA